MDLKMFVTLAAFVFIAYALLSGKLAPSFVCGAAVFVVWGFGVISAEEVFRSLAAPSILVMGSMMIVVGTLLRTGFLSRTAALILRARGNSYTVLLAVGMVIPFVLCHFIGCVTSLITVLPLLMALAKELGVPATRVVLPAAIGAQAGHFALPIGGGVAQYLMINQIAETVGSTERLGFWDLPLVRLPAALAVMVYVVFIGYRLLPERELARAEWQETVPEVSQESPLPRWKEWAVCGIFAATVVLMSCSAWLHIPMHMIPVSAAILCGFLRVCGEKEYFRMINWPLIFVIASLMSMSIALHNSGAGKLMAGLLSGVLRRSSTFESCAILFLIVGALTQVLDNTALGNLLLPLVIIACKEQGISMLPAVCTLRAASLVSFCTPLASPSSLTAYRLGGYTIKEMLLFTLPCVLIYGLFTVLWVPVYFSL